MCECCRNCKNRFVPRDRYDNKPEYWSCNIGDALCIEIVDDPETDCCDGYDY